MRENLLLLRRKLSRGLAHLPHLPAGLRLVWAAAPRWTVIWLVLLVMQGLLPAATVALTKRLVDSLDALLEAPNSPEALAPAIIYGLLMGAVMLASQVLGSISNWVRTALSELVQDYVNSMVHRQSVALDLAFYDSPEYFDRLHRARAEASYRPVALLENVGSLVQHGISLAALATVLIPYGAWLPLVLLVSMIPALYVTLQHNLRQHKWRLRTTADERHAWYYYWLLTAREAAAEIRLFALGDHLRDAYRTVRTRLRGERIAMVRDQSAAEVVAGLLAIAVMAAALLWVLRGALNPPEGEEPLTLGDLALFYQAFTQGQVVMRSLLSAVGQIFSSSLFLGNLFEFLALEPSLLDPPQPEITPPRVETAIRFEGVEFAYPESERAALDGFDLTVRGGAITAIVGPNGAGKSTLIKLLCRLYDPRRGRITLDGLDLRQLELAKLRGLITVLFQEPVQYNDTVAGNIAMGDLSAAGDADAIEAAAQAAGAQAIVESLPHGFDTLLGRLFAGGTDLSVGEWQRIALARAFLRQAAIIVLDEPTSAMDPWAEADWLRRFRALAEGRTALIVTHRFTTARYADTIHVMDEGQIVESGSHEELLAIGGRYAESWLDQMRRRGATSRDA